MKLLSVGNTKTMKGEARGYLTFILHLAPASLSGFNVCPGSSAGCRAACLNTSGRGKMNMVQAARVRKTQWFFNDRDSFMAQLLKDIRQGYLSAVRQGFVPVYRLNGTSDIRWEHISCMVGDTEVDNVMLAFPTLQFYDYTKLSNRKNLPANYHLTFSQSENNQAKVAEAFANGMNVATVFKNVPDTYNGRPVICGDNDDLRFLDATGVYVGLTAKGKAKKDISGFVV
jgi:hypothetical protein